MEGKAELQCVGERQTAVESGQTWGRMRLKIVCGALQGVMCRRQGAADGSTEQQAGTCS